MEVLDTPLLGAKIILPKIFKDDRGYFFESFNNALLQKHIGNYQFVQDNQSLSQKGVLRGLHFQNPPYAQGKLVRVIQGAVLDVIVDIRKNSPTFGKHFSCELSADNFKCLWIPPGFAHGFVTLQDNTIFFYKVSNYYHKASEGCIKWDDPDLGIDWQIDNPQLSQKDLEGINLKDFKSVF